LLSRRIAGGHSKWLCPTFKILFVKTSSLGDVVHHCPAVSDAARSIPGAEIDWVVEESFAAIPSMHPAVRRVLPLALRRWRHGWWRASTREEVRAFRRALRAESYDAVVDTQSLLKSALVAAQARGRSHGMDRASARCMPSSAIGGSPRRRSATRRKRLRTTASAASTAPPRRRRTPCCSR
jgi:lipopolysaccharide heptosyltransferase I